MDNTKRIEVLELISNLMRNIFRIEDEEEFKKIKENIPILNIINLINITKDNYKDDVYIDTIINNNIITPKIVNELDFSNIQNEIDNTELDDFSLEK
jgi:hypothetical protein